ncbi:hypothetical protein ACFOWM_04910 [Ferruginibacter yonginensis]|uniref:Uncharacterized protein n=1 Tax=Ferruginibacter yonginensis TaxID=1310416 RepID=A0ABV8QQV0_9BACT
MIQIERKEKNDDANSINSFIYFGDKCHRNTNGTVNADDCNFWENISVAVSSAIHCSPPTSTVGSPATQAEINAYYDCVQERICKNC